MEIFAGVVYYNNNKPQYYNDYGDIEVRMLTSSCKVRQIDPD